MNEQLCSSSNSQILQQERCQQIKNTKVSHYRPLLNQSQRIFIIYNGILHSFNLFLIIKLLKLIKLQQIMHQMISLQSLFFQEQKINLYQIIGFCMMQLQIPSLKLCQSLKKILQTLLKAFSNEQLNYFLQQDIMLLFKNNFGTYKTMARLRAFKGYHFGIIKFNLPDLGEKIKEGTIKKLYVKEGDSVKEFQKIADVASDKQFTQLTAADSGLIHKIFFKEDEVCQVGDLLLEIQTKEEVQQSAQNTSKQADKTTQHSKHHQEVQKNQTSSGSAQVLASPFVRGLIKKHGLDITKLKGSGVGGRLLQKDIELALNKTTTIEQKPKRQEHIQKPPTKPSEIKRQAPAPAKQSHLHSTVPNVSTVTMSNYEKGMQKSMTESNTIPHLYLHEEFDITEIEKMRKVLKESNKKVTVMGILIKTFSLALKQYPKMNSLYYPNVNPYEYNIYPNHNISIAVDSPNGLVVPHVKNVNNINLLEIQNELQRLRNLAKDAKLTAKQLQGGTVCLSNIGTIGGVNACPLILPPQVCIVAIGKLQSIPKYRGSELVERKVINVSYGCDHRVVDGATVARFSNAWKQLIENPYLSMAQMI